jgi:hypothetical protein
MTPEERDDVVNILYAALLEPIGLLLDTPEPHRARQALYAVRRSLGDATLSSLQFRASPIEGGTLVITKSMVPARALAPIAQPTSAHDGDTDLTRELEAIIGGVSADR